MFLATPGHPIFETFPNPRPLLTNDTKGGLHQDISETDAAMSRLSLGFKEYLSISSMLGLLVKFVDRIWLWVYYNKIPI